jgi:hypothetical protein
VWRRHRLIYRRERLFADKCGMGLLQLEVRDKYGKSLPQFCDDFLDQNLPVDHSRLAQSLLQLIRSGGAQPAVHSVHVLREGREIGSWSLDREGLEAVVAAAKQLDERNPRPRPKLRLVQSNAR